MCCSLCWMPRPPLHIHSQDTSSRTEVRFPLTGVLSTHSLTPGILTKVCLPPTPSPNQKLHVGGDWVTMCPQYLALIPAHYRPTAATCSMSHKRFLLGREGEVLSGGGEAVERRRRGRR